jgi:hypothetical protein
LLHCTLFTQAGGGGTGRPDSVRMPETGTERGDEVRERLTFGILILLLIFLFAFTFAVLGKGEYEPGGARQSSPAVALSLPG